MKWVVIFVLFTCLAACRSQQASLPPQQALANTARGADTDPHGHIDHIIIVIQENRTPDNLFQGLPGADIAGSGLNSKGEEVPLHTVPLESPVDPSHRHAAFLTEFDGGKMDGFDRTHAKGCNHPQTCVYGYVPNDETGPYFSMAEQYVFADEMFSTQQGPSFAAHQYLISGTSTTEDDGPLRVSDDPYVPGHRQSHKKSGGGGCDSQSYVLAPTIKKSGRSGKPVWPCFDRLTLADLLDGQHVSWRYYQMELGTGLWHPFDAIKHIRYGSDYANVSIPSDQILADIHFNKLAQVSWVAPAGINSDHPGNHGKGGPAWVASIVNAVGSSPYWDHCAIFITWDDWGGWFDHVTPPIRDGFELGFRVPLIVVSPYARQGVVSHHQYEFGTILKFVESTFKTGSMHTTDELANPFQGVFDFAQQRPRKFVRIVAPKYGIARYDPDSD